MTWGPARKFVRSAVFHSDHCSFRQETSALCSQAEDCAVFPFTRALHSSGIAGLVCFEFDGLK